MTQEEKELEEPVDPVGITPVNRVESGNRTYKYQYRYTGVSVEEFGGCTIPGVTTTKTEDGNVLWKYKNKPVVMVTEDGVFADDSVNRSEAQNQAYFALNYMAERGMVAGWSKQ